MATDTKDTAAGVAALAICEALLLAVRDLKLIGVKQVHDVLDDATGPYVHADRAAVDTALRREVVAHIKRIKASLLVP